MTRPYSHEVLDLDVRHHKTSGNARTNKRHRQGSEVKDPSSVSESRSPRAMILPGACCQLCHLDSQLRHLRSFLNPKAFKMGLFWNKKSYKSVCLRHTKRQCLTPYVPFGLYTIQISQSWASVGFSGVQWQIGTEKSGKLLRMVFLLVPTVPSPVGDSRRCWKVGTPDLVREGHEGRLASAYVLHPLGLPSSQFTGGQVRKLKQTRREIKASKGI